MTSAHQLDQYEVDATFGCFIWTGSVSSTNGRPITWLGRTPVNAYKAKYEAKYGAVKDELVLDHTCRRATSCVNPDHLEPVTKQENERRKSMKYRMRRTTCMRGHRLDEATRMLTPELGILCRVCVSASRSAR